MLEEEVLIHSKKSCQHHRHSTTVTLENTCQQNWLLFSLITVCTHVWEPSIWKLCFAGLKKRGRFEDCGCFTFYFQTLFLERLWGFPYSNLHTSHGTWRTSAWRVSQQLLKLHCKVTDQYNWSLPLSHGSCFLQVINSQKKPTPTKNK